MRLALIFCLLAASAFGQANTFRDMPFVGLIGTPSSAPAVFSPTNISGVAATSWWVADNIAATDMNSSRNVTNWPDAGPYGYTLTNRVAGVNRWPTNVAAGVNGHAYVHFETALTLNSLESARYTNAVGVHNVVMVARIWQPPTIQTYFFDSFNATDRNLFSFDNSTPAKLQIRTLPGGTAVGIQLPVTNKWMVWEVLFNGANSGWLTNNMSASGVVNPGTGPCDGLTLGNANGSGGGNAPSVDFAEIITYSNSLGTVPAIGVWSTSVNRSNLYNYLTNKYAITQ